MCFLHLVKEDNGVWFSPDCLSKLSALVISDVSRRRSDQTGHGIFLHILAHIDTDHIFLIVKQAFRKCFRKLRLSDSGRSKEEEGSDRLGRVFDPCLGTDDRLCHFCDAFILSNHTFVEFLVKMKCLAPLALVELCNRNSCPPGNDPCNLIFGHTLVYQRHLLVFDLGFLFFQLLFQLWQATILKFRCLFQVIAALRFLNLLVNAFDLLTKTMYPLQRGFLIVPLCLLTGKFFPVLRQFFLQFHQTLLT